jgi:hypothetical protein
LNIILCPLTEKTFRHGATSIERNRLNTTSTERPHRFITDPALHASEPDIEQ